MQCAINSITSTQKNEDFSLAKSMAKLENIFYNYKEADSRDVRILTAIMLGCSAAMIVFLAVMLSYNQRGLVEIKELFFADGACSDNMQLLEFMFNKGMNLKEYEEQPEFASILKSAQYETSYVFGLLAAEMLHISSMRTQLTRTPYYFYQFAVSDWILSSGKIVKVSTTEFMARLVYAQIAVMSYAGQKDKEQELLKMLESVKVNFPQMKENNHKFLQLYLNLFHEDRDKVEMLMWVKFAVHFLCSGFLFSAISCYYSKKGEKKTQIYSFLSLVTKKNAQELRQYYMETHSFFKGCISNSRPEERSIGLSRDRTKELKPEEYIWDLELRNKFVADTEKRPAEGFKFVDEKRAGYKYVLVGLFLALNSINAYLIVRSNDIFNASEKMMININSLMDSENYILEAYFDLKAEYLVKESTQAERERLMD